MKIKKNWFYLLIILLTVMGMLYLFINSFVSLGEKAENGNFLQAGVLCSLFAVWILIYLFAGLYAKLQLDVKLSQDKKWVKWVETLFVISVLVLAAAVRIKAVGKLPEAYLQEYKNYYEIAQALMDDSIQKYGERYCDSIASMPTIMGYSYFLMLAFKVFGVGARAGQYLNVFFSVGSAFFAYKIGRKAGGRISGGIALILCAFWPSQIAAVSVLSSESAFVFLVLLCIWIYISLIMDYDGDTSDAFLAVLLHFVLGVLLAAASAVNAASIIIVIAMFLILAPQKMKLPAQPKNDIPLMVRMLERGWVRCVMILVSYLIFAGVISSNIELAIDRTLPPMGIAYGSSLWEEVKANKGGKFENSFENEDYGIEKCRELFEEQKVLTEEMDNFLNRVGNLNQVIYVGAIFFTLVCFLYLLFKEPNPMVLYGLIFWGIAGLSFLTESVYEYYFIVTELFILSGAMMVWYTYKEGQQREGKVKDEKILLLKEAEMENYKLQLKEQEEERLAELRKEAYANVFDMEKALKEGHVVMTVTQAYADEKPAREKVQEKCGEQKREEEEQRCRKRELEKDEFDWRFTENELNSMVSADWAFVKPHTSEKKQKQER